MSIYLVRHGQSEANVRREFSNRGWKHPLTSAGEAQVRDLAQSDALRGAHIRRIYTSPLLRAVQTGEILARQLGCPCQAAPELGEFDCGELEGRSDDAGWALYAEIVRAWLLDRHWSRSFPGGESYDDVRARFVPFVQRLSAAGENVLLVGHGGTYRCMLPLVLDNLTVDYVERQHLPNAALIHCERLEDGRLVCRRWRETPLSAGELHSGRLRLLPLTAGQLQHYLDDPAGLEQELGLPLSRAVLSEVVQRAIQAKAVRMQGVPCDLQRWHTYWLVIENAGNRGVGLVGFKGLQPGGVTEIGYGIDPAVQGNGYASEAVRALCDWAFRQEHFSMAQAVVKRDNPASLRVLQKSGFCLYDEDTDALYWRIERERAV